MLGGDVNIIAPKELIPSGIDSWGVSVFNDMDEGIKNCDVIMMLRLQIERMQETKISDKQVYHKLYGLNHERLENAKKDVLVMHPGPINRGVEISSEVADGNRSVILQQVSNGIAVRMAILSLSMQP